jgi:hypothetical protein
VISAKDIDLLRSIAKAGSDYDAIKRLLDQTHWEIEEDDVDLGFLRIFIHDAGGDGYRLIISYCDPNHPPYFLLSFTVLPDVEENLPALNSAFRSAAETLTRFFGPPTLAGERRFSFRTWPYAYHRWTLPDGEFTLVQDEFDVQEGMDVTLWRHPTGTPLEEIVHT